MAKHLPATAADTRAKGLIPVSGRFPGVGNCNALQYSGVLSTSESDGLQFMKSQS